MRARLRAPAVQEVAEHGVQRAGAERPETHLGLLDTGVAAGEDEDEGVGERAAGGPAEDAADEGGEED